MQSALPTSPCECTHEYQGHGSRNGVCFTVGCPCTGYTRADIIDGSDFAVILQFYNRKHAADLGVAL